MLRSMSVVAVLLSLVLTLGCGGAKELKPDPSQVKQVDQADIQKQIEEGMKKGGMDQYEKRGLAPGGGEKSEGAK